MLLVVLICADCLFDVNPASLGGHKADGVSPVESRSITPQGGEAAALPFDRTPGFKLRVRYSLILLRSFDYSALKRRVASFSPVVKYLPRNHDLCQLTMAC